MDLQIIAVGNKMPNWVDQAYQDYAKRIPREIVITLTQIPVVSRKSNKAIEKLKKSEAQAIQNKITQGSHTLVLDEKGQQWSSLQWSQQLDKWLMYYPKVNLVIGGPDGLDSSFLQKQKQKIALGKMTLPHGLVRVVLIEQLYRAWTLLQGHPYHRA